jgi:hypothetical protein
VGTFLRGIAILLSGSKKSLHKPRAYFGNMLF